MNYLAIGQLIRFSSMSVQCALRAASEVNDMGLFCRVGSGAFTLFILGAVMLEIESRFLSQTVLTRRFSNNDKEAEKVKS